MRWHAISNLIIVVIGVLLAIYFIADDSPAEWLVRVSFAGAITAGLGVVLYALGDVINGRGGTAP